MQKAGKQFPFLLLHNWFRAIFYDMFRFFVAACQAGLHDLFVHILHTVAIKHVFQVWN